jgi:hypothetical protein
MRAVGVARGTQLAQLRAGAHSIATGLDPQRAADHVGVDRLRAARECRSTTCVPYDVGRSTAVSTTPFCAANTGAP